MILLLQACAGTGSVPEDHFYRLQPLTVTQPFANPPLTGVLKVERMDASGVLRDRAILFSKAESPQQLQRHHYHFWLDAPTELVRMQLVQYLRDRRVAQLVAAEYIDEPGDLRLHLELRDFSRQLQPGGEVRVHIALGAVIKGRNTRTPLLVKQYRTQVTAADSHMVASIQAFEQGLEALYQELVDDLVHLQ